MEVRNMDLARDCRAHSADSLFYVKALEHSITVSFIYCGSYLLLGFKKKKNNSSCALV